MTDSIAYAFKIYPVPSAMKLEGFYQFVRRLADQYGGYRITHRYIAKDGNVLIEFGSHFGLKAKPEKARESKGLMDAALRRICPDREMKIIVIENDQLLLDKISWAKILGKSEKLIIELCKSSTAPLAADRIIPLYEGAFIDARRRLVVDLKDSRKVSVEGQKLVIDMDYEKEKRFRFARHTASVQHGQPEETDCKLDKMRKLWLSGEYHSRDLCADISCKSLGISSAAAREVLGNMPEPCRQPL